MTNKEAIEQLRERLAITDYRQQIPEYYEAIELAVEALEKQIPKKPTKTKIATLNKSPEAISWEQIHCCPRCESNLAPQYKYCPQCGLKIEWSDENEES